MQKNEHASSSVKNEPGTRQGLHQDAGRALAGRSTTTEGNDDAFVPLTDWMPVQDVNRGNLIDALRGALVGLERNDDEPDDDGEDP